MRPFPQIRPTGVIIDAMRGAKLALALDRGVGGPLLGPSAYFMKSPPVQYHDDMAHQLIEDFAAGVPRGPGRRIDLQKL
jgi:myo-inositol-1-phosphate synthase